MFGGLSVFVTKVRVSVVLRSHSTLRKAASNSVFLCADTATAYFIWLGNKFSTPLIFGRVVAKEHSEYRFSIYRCFESNSVFKANSSWSSH